jgi:uncharacterized protein (TIGR00255 family)
MTGYGKSGGSSGSYEVQVEIKSVNHRFLDVNFRMPSYLGEIELALRERLKAGISRGSVTVFVNVSPKPGTVQVKKIDIEAVSAYKDMLVNIKEKLDLEGSVDLETLLKFQDIFEQQDTKKPDDTADAVRECFDAALSDMIGYREKEGKNICEDLEHHLINLEKNLEEVKILAADAAKKQFDKLLERLTGFINPESFNKERLEQELVLISDRVDISEEISRLYSHIDLFRKSMAEDRAVGKILNNLSQEMHREASTISAKTNLTEISHKSVYMKETIEIIREQVQNVE